jgi:hypothetical protein
MDDLAQKVEELLKSLLSLKTNAKKDFFVPALKSPSLNAPKPSIKQPTIGKIPSGLPPPSKKDPIKVAQQLKNPNPGKVNVEVLKIEENGQWSFSKSIGTKVDRPSTPAIVTRQAQKIAPINSSVEGFKTHSPDQTKLIHGLDVNNSKPMRGSIAGGAHLASNPISKQNVILKRASDHANQKERGHLDNGFNSAKREVLFHDMAHGYFGLGEHVPTTAGFSRDGEDYSVQEMKSKAKHVDLKDDVLDKPTQEGENPFEAEGQKELADESHGKILNKLHDNGTLHKLALMDNIMGHHDRHGGNYMVEGDDKLHLIDNGTSFDYKNFDTNDYPAYLKHTEDSKIKGMGKDGTSLHPEAVKWLNSLDSDKAKEILAAQGHGPNSSVTQGFLRRLQGMKNAVNNGQKSYRSVYDLLENNRTTSGPMYRHENKEPAWLID